MNVLGNTKLSHRLMLLVLLTALPFVAINIWTLLQAKDSLLEQKKLKTRHVVETAHSLLDVYASQVDEGVLSEAEAKTQAMNAVKRLRYEDREYFWINDMQVQMVMHPYKPQLDGTDLSDLKDPTGKKPFVEFVAAARDGGGFVDYMWPKPGADDPVPKISYVKKFEPWQWVV
ncbi:MAG: cache domain-containing protein, partial [Pseudomonadota bacterium]